MTINVCRYCGHHAETTTHDEAVCYWTRQKDIYERGAANARRQLAEARRQLRAAILSEQPATMTTSQTPEE